MKIYGHGVCKKEIDNLGDNTKNKNKNKNKSSTLHA